MSRIPSFTPALLSDYAGFKDYIQGKEDLEAIRPGAEPPKTSVLWKAWEVCGISIGACCFPMIILEAFYWVPPLNKIGLWRLGTFTQVSIFHLFKGALKPFSAWFFARDILVPAVNIPRFDASDIYMCPNIPARQITDSRIYMRTRPQLFGSCADIHCFTFYWRVLLASVQQGKLLQIPGLIAKVAFYSTCLFKAVILQTGWDDPIDYRDFRKRFAEMKKEYPFAHKNKNVKEFIDFLEMIYAQIPMQDPVNLYEMGICRGASEYFIHLCIESRKWFDDPEKWLKAVANQFKDGVPARGTLMQALFDIPSYFLNKIAHTLYQYRVSSDELDQRSPSGIQKIEAIPSGIYRVEVPGHAFVYIKLDNGESYTWDSSCGLAKQSSTELFDYVIKRYHRKGLEGSMIDFTRYRKFRWIPFNFLRKDGV